MGSGMLSPHRHWLRRRQYIIVATIKDSQVQFITKIGCRINKEASFLLLLLLDGPLLRSAAPGYLSDDINISCTEMRARLLNTSKKIKLKSYPN